MQVVRKHIIIAFVFAVLTGTIGAETVPYDSHDRRNPFLPPPKVTPGVVREDELIETGLIEEWFIRNIGGVICDAKSPHALIGDEIVSAGDEIHGCTIIEIKPESIVLQYKNKRVEVPLRMEYKENSKDES